MSWLVALTIVVVVSNFACCVVWVVAIRQVHRLRSVLFNLCYEAMKMRTSPHVMFAAVRILAREVEDSREARSSPG